MLHKINKIPKLIYAKLFIRNISVRYFFKDCHEYIKNAKVRLLQSDIVGVFCKG